MPTTAFQAVTLRAGETASATLYPHGAHVISWRIAGREHLFTSRNAQLRTGAAIRGGVPIIFPQFAGLGPLPKHGLARTAAWQLLSQCDDRAQLRLQDSAASRAIWPYRFNADYTIHLQAEALHLTLSINNTDAHPFTFTAALHTYLRIDNVTAVALVGLQGLHYSDTAAGGIRALQADPALRIVGEVDRIYYAAAQPIEVVESGRRIMMCSADGFTDAVIWNPGADKAQALSDLEADGYRRMLCVEAAVIATPVLLAPGATWSGTQHLKVE